MITKFNRIHSVIWLDSQSRYSCFCNIFCSIYIRPVWYQVKKHNPSKWRNLLQTLPRSARWVGFPRGNAAADCHCDCHHFLPLWMQMADGGRTRWHGEPKPLHFHKDRSCEPCEASGKQNHTHPHIRWCSDNLQQELPTELGQQYTLSLLIVFERFYDGFWLW